MLGEQGGEYRPPVDADAVIGYLTNDLRQTLSPPFARPDQRLELQFNIRGSEFAYGAPVEGTIAVVNRASEPLVLTEKGLFTGRIRVDARVSGDLDRDIPNLLSETIRTALVVPPGRSVTAPLRLSCGQLRHLLLDHPQASLDVQFTLYVDPVMAEGGAVRNRLSDLEPATVSIRRPGVDLSGRYVRSRFNAISSGQDAQKMRTAQLFTGLLKEQQAMAQQGTLYPFRYAEWLPGLLRSSLVAESGLLLDEGEGQWVVKVNVLADMLSLSLDQDLAGVVAKNLNHPQWPVRLMAIYLLATADGGNFERVLDWVAENDDSALVRSMALALRSARAPAGSAGTGGAKGTLQRLR